MAVGFACLVYIREAVLGVAAVSEASRNFVILLDKVGFFFFGVAGLLVILITEPYYRLGLQKRCLAERFALISGAELLVLGGCGIFLHALPGLSPNVLPKVWVVGIELAIGTAATWVWVRRRGTRTTRA